MQEAEESPEALAAAAAAAAEAAAIAAAPPVHEDNEWGIEVMPASGTAVDDVATEAGASGIEPGPTESATGPPLPEGLTFSMPAASVDAAELAADAVQATDASVDELANMLAGLNR
jgi:ubiquitin-like modifier-activating enzyme 5